MQKIIRKNTFRIFKLTSRAFTFIEILLVVSLLSVIGIAVYNAFANGLKIWDRGCRSFSEEDISILLDKLGQDLQNTLRYSQIPFEGKGDRVSFAAIIKAPVNSPKGSDKKEYANQIGKVEYYFDSARNGLFRRQANYGQASNKEFDAERLMAGSITSAKFLYYYQAGSDYITQNNPTNIIPCGIIIEINYGQDQRKMRRSMRIPVGS